MVINVMDLRKSFICSNKSSLSRTINISRNNIVFDKIYKQQYLVLKTEIIQ
jgi:hypothetical protein